MLPTQIHTENDKKIEYVRRLVQAIEALRISFDRIDDLISEANSLDYANVTTGITDAILQNNEFDYLNRALLLDAITQYNTLRDDLTPTVLAAFLRIRP